MPAKRRHSKRRVGPLAEAEAWTATFAGGWDIFGDLKAHGLDTPEAIRAAAPGAWRRFGRLYVDLDLGAHFNCGTGGSWALREFGEPPCQ